MGEVLYSKITCVENLTSTVYMHQVFLFGFILFCGVALAWLQGLNAHLQLGCIGWAPGAYLLCGFFREESSSGTLRQLDTMSWSIVSGISWETCFKSILNIDPNWKTCVDLPSQIYWKWDSKGRRSKLVAGFWKITRLRYSRNPVGGNSFKLM